MTMNRARLSLLGLFLAFLVAQLILILMMHQRLWPDELSTAVRKLFAIYAVYLGVILGGIFAHPRGVAESPSPATVWVAILVSLAWNILLFWRSALFRFSAQDSIVDLLKYLDTVAADGSFLVAGALGFFFAKGSQINPRPRKQHPPSASESVKLAN